MLVNQNAVFLLGHELYRLWKQLWSCSNHRKNNRFPFLDILEYLKNTHKNPKFGRVRQVPTGELGWEFPGWDLSSLCQIWDFYGYYLNTLKYPIRESVIFSGECCQRTNLHTSSPDSHLINFGANSRKLINRRIKSTGQQ